MSDRSTQSNYNQISTKHLHLNWYIDFNNKVIRGSASHTLISHEDNVSIINLDTSFLTISSIESNEKQLNYTLNPRHEVMGNQLSINLAKPLKINEEIEVIINYSTTESCTALAWLESNQTTGGDYPYVYSQCEAIHARSLLPCFDTPGVKSTYSAKVTSTLPVLLSGLRISPSKQKDYKELLNVPTVYEYDQPIPIPSYLIAVASGKLTYRAFENIPDDSKWSAGVFTEPELMEDSYWEFKDDTAKYVHTAEKVTGLSYNLWSVYDILIQPKSAPFGGMENCNITFATPTLLAGDRSLTDVIGHEISHSWFGNLISCANWGHFWLNEGFTTYLERLLLHYLHSPSHRDFSYIIGRKALQESLDENKHEPRFQKLVIPYVVGEDPDDAFSSVPYDKGANFLYYLEKTVGGLDVFLPFVKSYVQNFKGKSITTEDFHQHLFHFYENNTDALKALNTVDWNAWYNGSGDKLPVEINYDTSLADEAYNLAYKWDQNKNRNSFDLEKIFNKKDIENFNSNQVVVFLEKLQSFDYKFSELTLIALDNIYNFNVSTNAEIRFRFYMLALKSGSKYSEEAAKWTAYQGRMKFCRPLYRALNNVNSDLAKNTFLERQYFYHPIAAKQIRKDLGLDKSSDNNNNNYDNKNSYCSVM